MPDRRHFLTTTATGLVASLALRGNLLAQLEKIPPLPDHSLFDKNEDAYWAGMRKQFLIPEDEIYLNNGTVGSSPAPVLRAIFDGYATTEKMDQQDPEDYPIWGYASWNEFRDPLAAFVGCHRDEIALLRNATEANSYIANGIDLKPGDEVLMTDQEHPGGLQPWRLRAKRYGVVVKTVTLPKPVKDANQVLNLFNDAITERTRVIFFSHITTVTGVVLPAKQLCALARSKNILSAVDGAHVVGMMRLNLQDIGCDMYSSSPHKWLQVRKDPASSMCATKSSTGCGTPLLPKAGMNSSCEPSASNASVPQTSPPCAGWRRRSSSQTKSVWIESNAAIANSATTFSGR